MKFAHAEKSVYFHNSLYAEKNISCIVECKIRKYLLLLVISKSWVVLILQE